MRSWVAVCWVTAPTPPYHAQFSVRQVCSLCLRLCESGCGRRCAAVFNSYVCVCVRTHMHILRVRAVLKSLLLPICLLYAEAAQYPCLCSSWCLYSFECLCMCSPQCLCSPQRLCSSTCLLPQCLCSSICLLPSVPGLPFVFP